MQRPRHSQALRIPPTMLAGVLALLIVTASGSAAAAPFHRSGVGACQVCHVMHDSDQGLPVMGAGEGGYSSLLRQGSPSDVCLSCHATDAGHVLGASPLTPPPEMGAGNFVFLLEDNLNDAIDGGVYPIAGDAAGHNVRALSYGLNLDPRYTLSPGGNFPANIMRCTSCHDPHGNSSYRMLRGAGPVPGGGYRFRYPAPEAVGIPLDGAPESATNHTAYLGGMSLWCANCHEDYLLGRHNDPISSFQHPVSELMESGIVAQYNVYAGTANPAGGLEATAYLPEVPFEDPYNTTDRTAGPTASSQLMCLTCHRAHTSSSPAAGRWDFNVDKLGEDGVASGSYPIPNPYLDPDQDPLCFKCHATGSS